MTPIKEKAAGLQGQAASKTTSYLHHNVAMSPQQGKAFAMFLYNTNAASLEATQDEFRRHPHWRRA